MARSVQSYGQQLQTTRALPTTGTDNVYDITIAFSDGTNDLAAQTTAVTVTDANDQTPAVSVASTYSHAEAAATTFQTYTITDSDTSGTYTCTLGGDDAADFTASISGKVCTVVWAAAPNYESPADTDTDNVYDITIAFSDGTNDLAAQTTAVTVTDANDQTPSVSVSSTYTQAEAASTTWQTFTITDSDTSGTYTCTLGGDDAADFSASISGKVCTIVWAANPDYDSAADTDTDNVYDITIAFSDGTNDLAAQTTAVTVTDVNDQTPSVSVASTYSHAEAAATTFQTYTITDSDTSGTYTCTLGGDDAADFSASISGKVCTVVWAAAPNYESPADDDTDNVYDITIAFSDGTNDLAAQTTAVTVTDANDQTPAVSVASTYSHAEAAATTFQTYTITDSDTSGTYTCTLGGDDAADFSASISGKVCTVVWAAAPNYESPADDDTDNVYDITIAFSDGTNDLAAQTTAVTVTDVNDQTPAVSVASTYSHAEAAATTFQTYTITDSDTSGTYTCTLGGDDAADFTASISGKVCTVVWAAAPNYESPADTDTDNVYDITIAFSDGTNDLAAQTTAVTVTDANDQTPSVSVSSTYTQAEAASTTWQTFTITDSDTSGTYTCTLGGDDAADFSASISGKVCTIVWAANPDYDSAADTDTDNVYDITIAFSDGTNDLAAQTTAVTVTDVNDQTPSVSVASTYSHAEAAATTFQTYTITDSDTSGTYTCTLGGDDAADFSASISGKVCTVVWAAAPNYESPADDDTDNVYDITIAFSDGTNDLAAQTTAVTVTDTNDQTPSVSVASTYSHAEAAATTFQTYTITDSDTSGTYTCTLGGDDAADFSASISGKVCTVVWAAAPNYESPADTDTDNVYDITIAFSDGTNDLAAQTTAVTVTDTNDQTPAVSVASTYSHAEAAATTFQTYTITDSDTSGTYTCTLGGDDAADFTASISGKVCTVVWAAAPNYESPADTDTDNVYDITIAFSDGTNDLAAQTTAVTVTDVNDQAPTYSGGDVTPSVAEGTTAVDSFTVVDTDSGDVNACSLGGADAASFACAVSGDSISIAFSTAPDYETPGSVAGTNVYAMTATISDGTNTGSALSYTVTVTDATEIIILDGQTGSVAEDASAGDAVMTVTITDSTPTAILFSAGNGDGIFAIATSGAVTIADATNLDYETTTSYTLTIVAYDASSSDVAEITISITDANDAPSAGADQTGSVTEDASTTTATGTVAATDADTSDTLSYTIGTAAGTYGAWQ
ncbi:MAG: beta strand repeat-containing protein [Candidatus Thalassarchaeaceae archaeon]